MEQLTGIARVDVIGELLKEGEKDEAYVERRKVLEAGTERGAATVEGGLIREGGKIVLPDTNRARLIVVHECHDTPEAGH